MQRFLSQGRVHVSLPQLPRNSQEYVPSAPTDATFSPLHKAHVFTKLNLCIYQGEKWKPVFNAPLRHFEYLVMLFGLNIPAIFQTLVNDILRDILKDSCL